MIAVEHGDDSGRENRLGLFQFRVRILEITKDVPASFDQSDLFFTHCNSSFFKRAVRAFMRATSA